MLRRTFISWFVNCFAALSLFGMSSCSDEDKLEEDGGGDDGGGDDGGGDDGGDDIDWSAIDSKATVRGVVTCNGTGVQGVVVTDGFNMSRTNSQGAYGLRTSSDETNLVYLTIPSGYEVGNTHGFIPYFYRRVSQTSLDNVQRIDFTLSKVSNDHHIMIVSADTHVRNRSMITSTNSTTPEICPPKGELDSATFQRYFLKNLQEYVKTLPSGVAVYGINLGDMTQESHWGSPYYADLSNYVDVVEEIGMPIQTFHLIGNHDHDMSVQNISGEDDSEADLAYRTVFGPTYYAFNLGKVHYAVFDNTQFINTNGDRDFDVHVNQRQLDWAEKDANYMSSDVERIILCLHCPSFRRNPKASSAQPMDNAQDLLDIYAAKGVPITIWSGHNHIAETTIVPRSDVDVVEYDHPAVCGAWWYFPLCHDGAPSTFTQYEFTSGQITKRRSYNFTYTDEQYCRVYNSGMTNSSGKAAIVLNVWDYSERWTFECTEDGVSVPSSQLQVTNSMYDPYYQETRSNTGNSISSYDFLDNYYTDHLLVYTPVTISANIKIKAYDEFGDELFVVDTKIE